MASTYFSRSTIMRTPAFSTRIHTRRITESTRQTEPIKQTTSLTIPLANSSVAAGFPSPAEEFADTDLDLNDHLIKHPSATFFVRVSGTSMKDAGIFPDDLLVVDRAVEPYDHAIVIAIIDGEFTVKRFRKIQKSGTTGNEAVLLAENASFHLPQPEYGFDIWGVVTASIRQFH